MQSNQRSVLPDEIQVGRFLASRSAEIQLLCNEVSKSVSTGKLASQQVSRRMRRRAVSHNPKRLPRRLREAHINQRNKGCTASVNNGIGTVKKPSRRWRRRPKNLLSEYNRRQNKTAWLETHIWHAKRFHMATKWGHAMPQTPTDKCWRQTHRAISSGSIMWDISYTKLIEMSGETETLLTHLNTLTEPSTEEVFISGPGERSAVVFRPGQYPRGVITRLTYLWSPDSRTLWAWVQPGSYQELLQVLTEVCHLTAADSAMEDECNYEEIDKVTAAKLQLKKTSPDVLEGNGIRLTLLDNRLNRIKLRGPKTLQVLQQCLIPDNNLKEGSPLSRYFSEDERGEKSAERGRLFSELGGAGTGRTVVGLNVRDPRLTLPVKRRSVKDLPSESPNTGVLGCELGLQESGLWSREVRDSVGAARLSDRDINTARQTGALASVSSPAVPVLLIAQPGGEDGWGSGWDLVLPPGWAMSFWMCLVYLGVRVGGQRELEQLELEAGYSEVVSLEDSLWARTEAAEAQRAEREKYFSYPPDKRPNFPLFGTLSPFCRDWDSLVGAGWFMLREAGLLAQLEREEAEIQHNSSALVQIRLKLPGRGKLSANTMIYCPTTTDLEADTLDLTEPQHSGKESESERKEARKLHQVKMKKLKRHWKRIKTKKTLLELSSVANDCELPEDKMDEIKMSLKALKGLREIEKVEYKEKSEQLWIPDKKTGKIEGHNSRELVGWVVRGGYSLRAGGEVGLGIVRLDSLISLRKENVKQVLVKQPDSSQYRMANFHLIQ